MVFQAVGLREGESDFYGYEWRKQQIHRLEAYIIAFGCMGKSTVSWVLHFYGVSIYLWYRDILGSLHLDI